MRNHSNSSFALNLTSLVLLLSLSLAMIHSKSEVITLTPDTFTDKVIIIYNLTLFCICFVFHSDIKILRIHGSIMNAILDYGFFFISVVSLLCIDKSYVADCIWCIFIYFFFLRRCIFIYLNTQELKILLFLDSYAVGVLFH